MSYGFQHLDSILDALPEQVVVIDGSGVIKYVNQSWETFGLNNGGQSIDWLGINYLKECDLACEAGDLSALEVVAGITSVLEGEVPIYQVDYPCHSPYQQRWFTMRITPFEFEQQRLFLIVHLDVTARKLAENEVKRLAHHDSLTKVANRRRFDEFYDREWRRCQRRSDPLCLALVDIDYFKELNDTFGHQVGDRCLIEVSQLLDQYCGRSCDLCARYGGDEFAIVWSGMALKQAQVLTDRILHELTTIEISGVVPRHAVDLTLSIGLVEVYPSDQIAMSDAIQYVDDLLYQSKENGRAQVTASVLKFDEKGGGLSDRA